MDTRKQFIMKDSEEEYRAIIPANQANLCEGNHCTYAVIEAALGTRSADTYEIT